MAISKRHLLIIDDSSKHSPELQLPNTHQQLSMITKKDDCSSQHYLPELESSSTHGHQEASIFDHWCFLKTILLYSITKQPPPTRTRIFQHSWSSAACQLLHEHCVELFFLGRVGSGRGRSKIGCCCFHHHYSCSSNKLICTPPAWRRPISTTSWFQSWQSEREQSANHVQVIHRLSYRKVHGLILVFCLSHHSEQLEQEAWPVGSLKDQVKLLTKLDTLPQETKKSEYCFCKSPHCSRSVSTPRDLRSSLRIGRRRCSSPTSARSPRCRTSDRRLPCKDKTMQIFKDRSNGR